MPAAVLGSAGQLGRDLAPRLARLVGDVAPLTRADLDLDRPESITAYFAANKPDLFVNCAAYNFVDKAEADPEPAARSNAWGVRALALACRAAGTTLVHFSTDYVFGLDPRTTPWSETDAAPGPVSVYGTTKLAGEYAVRAAGPDHLVIRTCGLYGVHGSGGKGGNFVETMLKLAGQGKPLRVVADQHCTRPPPPTWPTPSSGCSPDKRGALPRHQRRGDHLARPGGRGVPAGRRWRPT